MKLSNSQLIDVIGTVAVVASLIFVGAQLMMERRIAQGQMFQTRAELRSDNLRGRLESTEYAIDFKARFERGRTPPWWNKDIENYYLDSGVAIEEIVREFTTRQLDMVTLDNLVFQSTLGLLESSYLDSLVRNMVESMDSPVERAAFLQNNYSPETRRLVQEQLKISENGT